MASLNPIELKDFSGGLNQCTFDDSIEDNELADVLNMNLNVDKTISSRKGPDQHNATLIGAGRVTSLYHARTSSGGTIARLATTKQKIYKDDGAGDWTDITGSTEPPNDTLWMWRTFNNVAIGVNGLTVPQKYAFGAACVDLGGSPPDRCSVIEVFQNRVYLAGDEDEPTALHACAVGNSGDWTTSGDAFTVYVDKDNGWPVVGLVKFFNQLVILKRKGVYLLTMSDNDPTNMSLVQVFDDVGCVSSHSIRQIGNECVWLDDDGVYALKATQDSGDVAYSSISQKIPTAIQDREEDLLDEVVSQDVRSLNQYRLYWPRAAKTENDFVLVRDYYHGAWLLHEGIGVACTGRWVINGVTYNVCGGYDGKVYKMDIQDSDDGEDFTKKIFTKRFTAGTAMIRKYIPEVYLEYAVGGSFAIGYTFDMDHGKMVKSASLAQVGDELIWDEGNWDEGNWASQGYGSKFVKIGKKARGFQHQFLNTIANQAFSVSRIVVSPFSLSKRGP